MVPKELLDKDRNHSSVQVGLDRFSLSRRLVDSAVESANTQDTLDCDSLIGVLPTPLTSGVQGRESSLWRCGRD